MVGQLEGKKKKTQKEQTNFPPPFPMLRCIQCAKVRAGGAAVPKPKSSRWQKWTQGTEGELVAGWKCGKSAPWGWKSVRSAVFTTAHIYIVLEVHRTGAHGEPCAMLPSARKLGHQWRCEGLQRQQSQTEKLQLVYMYLSPAPAGLPGWSNSFTGMNTF